MKTKVDKLDVDKLVPVPADLSKLGDVVKNDVKKDVCDAKIKYIEDYCRLQPERCCWIVWRKRILLEEA